MFAASDPPRGSHIPAAEAVLASAEYDPDTSEDGTHGSGRVQTGFKELDEELDGGLRRGQGGVVSICGESREGREIANSLLATHLVSYPESSAAIIDTTGAFSVVGLFEVLVSKAKTRNAVNARTDDSHHNTMGTSSERALERVNIMRVFDLIGVREAVEEIKENLEEHSHKEKESLRANILPVLGIGHGEVLGQQALSSANPVVTSRREVADSEDEDDDDDDDDMLMDPTPERGGSIAVDPITEPKKTDNSVTPRLHIILIDNIGQVISPAIKSNYVQGHALLTSFLRTLNHLAATHDLLILLFNNALTPYNQPQPPVSRNTKLVPFLLVPETQRQFIPSSIFASNTAYPALGQTFPYFLDVVLLVSSLPSKRRDARLFYAENERRSGTETVKGVKMETVVEVVQDRFEGRVGRWATLKP